MQRRGPSRAIRGRARAPPIDNFPGYRRPKNGLGGPPEIRGAAQLDRLVEPGAQGVNVADRPFEMLDFWLQGPMLSRNQVW